MESPVTVNTISSHGSSPDRGGVTPEASYCVGRSNGMSVVPCKGPCTLLHVPRVPMLKLLDLLNVRDILATAKTCRHLN
uniref:hypothetical protein n=1 Tax=Endozoicomonas sp. ONNA2 TaxID=2828741 RepID=UPI002149571A